MFDIALALSFLPSYRLPLLAATPVIPFDAFISFMMIGAVLVAVAIAMVLVAFLLRARRQTTLPRQTTGNRRLELIWTAGPAVAVIFIFSFMFYTMLTGATPGAGIPEGQEPDIEVIGHQWWWEFRYPKQGNVVTANEAHIPVGQRVLVSLTSVDVQHDFWVPELGEKMDLYPNKVNYIWLEATQPGTYLGVCAEFCGTQHAWMRIRVVAEPQTAFAAWANGLRVAPAPASDQAKQGSQVFAQSVCGSCHLIAGTPHSGIAAPALTNFGSRETISAGVLANTPENLARYLRDPQAVKPGVLMPNFHLSDGDVAALVAYLEGLK